MDINAHTNNWACKGTIMAQTGGSKHFIFELDIFSINEFGIKL